MQDPWAESCANCKGLYKSGTAAMDVSAAGSGQREAERVVAQAASAPAAHSLAPAGVSCSALSCCVSFESKRAPSLCATAF